MDRQMSDKLDRWITGNYGEDQFKEDYCSQNDGDCSTCSLVNYGHDCHNNPVNDQSDKIDPRVITKPVDPITKEMLVILQMAEAWMTSQMTEDEAMEHTFNGHDIEDCVLCEVRHIIEKAEWLIDIIET